jgi:Tfp pilus assembly protein PilW
MLNKLKLPNKSGFTIIELLIAMAGFSFVLLLVTVVMINIGSLYSKGINQTRIDDAARSIVDDVSNKLKYSQASSFNAPSTTNRGITYFNYCIGTAKFSLSYNQTTNYMRIANNTNNSCPSPSLLDSTNGTNLLPANSKLAYFNIVHTGSTFTASIAIIYGNFTNTNIGTISGGLNDDNLNQLKCNTGSTYQYCAVTNLSTVVSSRIN